MATVRFSEGLKSDIRVAAGKLFADRLSLAYEATDPAWGQAVVRAYTEWLGPKVLHVPVGFLQTKDVVTFSGVKYPRSDKPTITVGQETPVSNVLVPYSAVPYTSLLETGLCALGTGYRALDIWIDGDDPKWANIVPAIEAYDANINALAAEQKKFVAGVEVVVSRHATLAPALKDWPPLWDLLDEATKKRHRTVTNRSRLAGGSTTEDGTPIDLDQMTAAVVAAKMAK